MISETLGTSLLMSNRNKSTSSSLGLSTKLGDARVITWRPGFSNCHLKKALQTVRPHGLFFPLSLWKTKQKQLRVLCVYLKQKREALPEITLPIFYWTSTDTLLLCVKFLLLSCDRPGCHHPLLLGTRARSNSTDDGKGILHAWLPGARKSLSAGILNYELCVSFLSMAWK